MHEGHATRDVAKGQPRRRPRRRSLLRGTRGNGHLCKTSRRRETAPKAGGCGGGADTYLAVHLTIPAARPAAPTQRRVVRARAAAHHDRHAWLQPLDASERAAATVVMGTTADPQRKAVEAPAQNAYKGQGDVKSSGRQYKHIVRNVLDARGAHSHATQAPARKGALQPRICGSCPSRSFHFHGPEAPSAPSRQPRRRFLPRDTSCRDVRKA